MSVTAPLGFVASGIGCGIKESGDLDLALLATDDSRSVPAAGVFTTNLAPAAPVVVSRAHLASSGGRAAAVLVSSGNANAATGAAGIEHAERMCGLAAAGLGAAATDVLVCQTGLIGIPLPMALVEAGIPRLVKLRGPGHAAAEVAAAAMMTTDKVRKETVVQGSGFVVGGMAKGAAMLAPQMAPHGSAHATMLAVLTTDAVCEPPKLSACLATAVDATFNRMTVDGCTSTNDTVVVLASGRSEVAPGAGELTDSLLETCGALAAMMVADAEGGTKVARVVVSGAASESEAHLAARKVAQSPLVKCSLNGEDPYWGRVVSELGSAGVDFVLDRVQVSYGGTVVCRNGMAAEHDVQAVKAHMRQQQIEIDCELGVGGASATVLTCDLGYGYIDENRTTS